MKNKKLFSPFFIPIYCICIALIIEIFCFNFRALESRSFVQISSDTYTQEYSLNASVQNFDAFSGKKMISFDATGDCYIEITGLHEVLSNIYLNISDSDVTAGKVILTLSACDEGNALYYDLPQVDVKRSSVTSHYIKLNLSGKASAIKIRFGNANGKTFLIDPISFNTPQPFSFSMKRVLTISGFLFILYCMRPHSKIYTIDFNPKKLRQKIFLLFILILEIVCFYKAAQYNPDYTTPPWPHHAQYAELAKSITEGHFYLDETPSDSLKELENPYDYTLRTEKGTPYQWDEAYYNGHYYVYFGIVPVLCFYLPYYMLTGNAFPTWWGIIIVQTGILIGILFLLNTLIKTYFKKTSLGMFLLMNSCLVFGSGIAIISTYAMFYQLPIAMAVFFTIWGLYFWISSKGSHILRLIAGSICMALVAGCRPQLLLGSFLAIPIILSKLWKMFQSGQHKKALIRLITALLPFILFAMFIMYYNFVRFGSPFDFGANYNLTTNDMTHRGFHLDRLPLGFYMYLLQPPCFATKFPFITFAATDIQYQGITITEKMFGGFLWLNPLLFSLFFFHKFRTVLKEKQLYIITGFCIISGIILVALDTQMAGILFRYNCDFGFFLSLASVCILMSAEASYEAAPLKEECIAHTKQMYFRHFLYIAAIITLVLWGLTLQCIFNTVN